MGLWTTLLVTAAAGIGGTGLGGTLATLFRRDSGREASLLLSFAAGVMVSVSCFGLLTEAAAPGAMELVALGVFGGCAVSAGLNALLDHGRPAGGLILAGLVMAAAIALHNVPEGMVIGASFIGGTVRQGWTMAAVIGLHNIPEGMAVAVPLISGGTSRVKATLLTAACGLPTVLGAWLGFWLGDIGPLGLTLSLGFASGAMLYVVFGEIMPESYLIYRSKLPAFAVMIGLALGMLMIFF